MSNLLEILLYIVSLEPALAHRGGYNFPNSNFEPELPESELFDHYLG